MKPHEAPACVLLDTNIWLDWLVFADPWIEPLQAAQARGLLVLVATPRMRAELSQVLDRLVLRTEKQAERLPRALPAFDAVVAMQAEPPAAAHTAGLVCTDPDDQMFLDLLVHPGVEGLITKDKALLRLQRRARPCQRWIASPGQWPQAWMQAGQRRLEWLA